MLPGLQISFEDTLDLQCRSRYFSGLFLGDEGVDQLLETAHILWRFMAYRFMASNSFLLEKNELENKKTSLLLSPYLSQGLYPTTVSIFPFL